MELSVKDFSKRYKIDQSLITKHLAGTGKRIKGMVHYDTTTTLAKELIRWGQDGMITKTTAKDEFKMKDEELKKLHCNEVANPHYRQQSMFLFYKKQVKKFIEKHPRTERKKTAAKKIVKRNLSYKQLPKHIPELTAELISEALYVVNKQAKKYRDMQLHYRKNELYQLKNSVLYWAKKLDWLKSLGYHQQLNHNYEDQFERWLELDEIYGEDNYHHEPEKYFYLRLDEFCGFQFHSPIDEPEGKYLGEIEIIPAEKSKEITMTFEMAEDILNEFLNKNKN